MRKPTNTTEDFKQRIERGDPSVILDAMPGGIEAEERRGQAELVASESLPTDIARYGNPADDRGTLERWGFKLGEPFPEDPMFMPVELPKGWKREGTDHAMHSSVLDAKGRKRIAVFYKAASYDRRADMTLAARYDIDFEVVKEGADGRAEVVRHNVVDRQKQETLKVFDGEYTATSDLARAYLAELVDDPSNPSHWTE